jgi:hypothetical protein
MSVTMPDPAARLLDLRAPQWDLRQRSPRTRRSVRPKGRRHETTPERFVHRPHAHGRGSFRGYAKADPAARWVAQDTGEPSPS